FFFQAEDGIRDRNVTGVQTCALPILEILNESETPPFSITDVNDIDENVRLKYRYIDLRRESLAQTFKMRHQITRSVRNYLDEGEIGRASCRERVRNRLAGGYENTKEE